MVHPQVANGGMASNMEGSYEYIEYAVADSVGVGRDANNSSPQKCILLRNVHAESLGPGLILRYDLSN